ncbi:unnamed protein product [Rotaria magnacalcarata]|nr:unnamed protein product [Rotaria magnacalcarata]
MQLRIDLEDAEGKKAWALYSTFQVGDAASEYVLSIGGYSGDAGNAMTYPSREDLNSNGMKFSTQDNDNDLWLSGNCAELYKGGWWFNHCSAAHLNGLPIVGSAPNGDGIRWNHFRRWSHSMKKATMKLRPVSLDF